MIQGALSQELASKGGYESSMPNPHLMPGEVAITPIGVKQLLVVLEMARAGDDDANGAVTPQKFLECLHTCGF